MSKLQAAFEAGQRQALERYLKVAFVSSTPRAANPMNQGPGALRQAAGSMIRGAPTLRGGLANLVGGKAASLVGDSSDSPRLGDLIRKGKKKEPREQVADLVDSLTRPKHRF